jgi:HprK-related kinase B
VADAPSIARLDRGLRERHPVSGALDLDVGGCAIRVDSNSEPLLSTLRDYFRRNLREPGGTGEPDIHITALEAAEPDFGVAFTDWPREAGKSGRKEEFADLPDGRIVRKVRTGMQFLIGERRLAVGACLKNANQIINLVNSQYMAWVLDRGYVLCHAEGGEEGIEEGGQHGRKGLGMAGTSGAGKSTLALHLISGGMRFVSNDRLLVRRDDGGVEMRGVPKMPRINPGTILANPDLRGILEPQRIAELERLDRESLWQLEEKYDADVERLFGEGRVVDVAPMVGFVVLTWSFRNPGPAAARRTTLRQSPELLEPIMKHPGPFILDGRSQSTVLDHDPAPYLEHMGEVPVLELGGGVDFELAAAECRRLIAEA